MARPKREIDLRPSARNAAADEYISQFHIDPSMIDTDEWRFAWVVTHCMNQETQDIEVALRKGYEPVRSSDFPELAKHSTQLRAIMGRGETDDFVRNGSQILMKCPRMLHDKRQRELEKLNKRQLTNVDVSAGGDFRGAPTAVRENRYSRTTEAAFAQEE